MIELIDETGRLADADLDLIRLTLADYLEEFDSGAKEITGPRFALFLVDDARIQELNRDHRQLDEPTDVLSYPLNEPDDIGFPQLPFLGDVFVSLDTAASQADTAGHGLLDEILVLAAHGHTHLRGYDHQTEEEWKTFEAAQSRILEQVKANRSV